MTVIDYHLAKPIAPFINWIKTFLNTNRHCKNSIKCEKKNECLFVVGAFYTYLLLSEIIRRLTLEKQMNSASISIFMNRNKEISKIETGIYITIGSLLSRVDEVLINVSKQNVQ